MEARHVNGPRMAQCYPCPVRNQDGFTTATYAQRFIAISIDWIMCLAVSSRIPVSPSHGKALLPLALFFIEVFLLTTLQGASAGQRIMKLKVISKDSGQTLSIQLVAVRTLLICLVIPSLLVVNKQGYHDRFCHSVVTRVATS